MKEHVFTITASAPAASLVISTPLFSSEPSMISASTRFLAQPSEIRPTRRGRCSVVLLIKGREATAKIDERNGEKAEPLWRAAQRVRGKRQKLARCLRGLIHPGAQFLERIARLMVL